MSEASSSLPDATGDLTLREALGREHVQLEALLGEVTDAFETNNLEWAARAYERLERRLGEHMVLEEEHIFPLLAKVAPIELAALHGDHARIRAQLAALGVAVELHAARAPEMTELVRSLREHAQREDALAYRCADELIAPPVRHGLLARLRDRMARR